MKFSFVGTSHLAKTLRRAAALRGLDVVPSGADLFFVAEDVLDHSDTSLVHVLFEQLLLDVSVPIVLVSQVPPGTTRKWAGDQTHRVFYQVDTLRLKDALHRAVYPEQIVIGCADPTIPLPLAYQEYLMAFDCPVLQMSYESAEVAKCGINYVLAKQIEAANHIADAAYVTGADYDDVERVLRNDSRIGPDAYLKPGQPNQHLNRDVNTIRHLNKPSTLAAVE